MSDVPCFVGIDVAKAQLGHCLRPSGERWAVPNDASGVATLVDQLQALHPTLIVLEATGGLERAVTSALATAGLPVVVVNPRQVRDFARATGQLAKTDALDARALAHFADVIRPTPRPLPDAQTQELRALLGRRQQLIAMRTAEQNRLAGTSGRLTQDIEAHIAWLNARIATLDDDLETMLRAARCGEKTTTCCRVPRALAPCVRGRCCWNSPSWGRSRGSKSRPWSAWRPSIATAGPCAVGAPSGEAARMCAPCSTWARSWPRASTRGSKPFTNGFSLQGKSKKVALTACMHKLLTILNAMLKHRKAWQAQEVQN